MQIDVYSEVANESVERYKVRFMAKSYTETYGINYEETFASIA
jgi:hypothetical protein